MYLQKSCNSAFYTIVRLKSKPLEKAKKTNPIGKKFHYLVLANLKSTCPKQWNQVVVVLSSRFESRLGVQCFLEHNA